MRFLLLACLLFPVCVLGNDKIYLEILELRTQIDRDLQSKSGVIEQGGGSASVVYPTIQFTVKTNETELPDLYIPFEEESNPGVSFPWATLSITPINGYKLERYTIIINARLTNGTRFQEIPYIVQYDQGYMHAFHSFYGADFLPFTFGLKNLYTMRVSHEPKFLLGPITGSFSIYNLAIKLTKDQEKESGMSPARSLNRRLTNKRAQRR